MGQSNIEAAMKVAEQMYNVESQNSAGTGIDRSVSWAELDDREKNLRANAIDMLSRTDWISYTRRAILAPTDKPEG